jgi:periplasmic protein TonB
MKRAPQKARSIMERRLFDTGVLPRKRQRAITLPVSITLHAAVVAAALIVPILGDSSLPEVSASAPILCIFGPPPAPVASPPPLRGDPVQTMGKPKLPLVATTGIVAPTTIPEALPTEDPVFGGDIAGDPNGVVGGWGNTPAGTIVGGLPTATAVATRPYRISDGVREPRKVRHVPPVYPEIARTARVQGTVVLECTIDPRGRVVNAAVVQGNPLLNEAALAAVQQWVYTPTLLSGIPVPVLMQVSVNFMLH